MLGDEDRTVKRKAVYIIQKIINAEEGNLEGERDPIREFHIPRCNFAATSYADLINLKTMAVGMVSSILPTEKNIWCWVSLLINQELHKYIAIC